MPFPRRATKIYFSTKWQTFLLKILHLWWSVNAPVCAVSVHLSLVLNGYSEYHFGVMTNFYKKTLYKKVWISMISLFMESRENSYRQTSVVNGVPDFKKPDKNLLLNVDTRRYSDSRCLYRWTKSLLELYSQCAKNEWRFSPVLYRFLWKRQGGCFRDVTLSNEPLK